MSDALTSTIKSTHKRSVAVDFLRIIAITAVVCVHTLPVPILKGTGLRVLISAAVGSLSKIGVPLFLIITGYLMLDRDYSGSKLKRFLRHNYLPLLVSFEGWVVIATAMKLVVDPAIDTMSAGLRTMLCIGEPFMVHFWYMQMLLGIYLFIPVIAAFIKACGEQADRYVRLLIIVGIVFLLIFPTIQMMYNWTGGTSAYEMTLGGFVGRGALGLLYMLLGYAIKKNLFSVDGNVARIGLVVVSLVLLWGLSTLELSLTSTIFPATTGFFPIAFAAFAFANWMIHTPLWNQFSIRFANVLQYLAGYAFGIYMVHPLIHEVMAKLIPQDVSFVRILSLNPISIFLISLCCCILLSQFKLLRKWLLLQK